MMWEFVRRTETKDDSIRILMPLILNFLALNYLLALVAIHDLVMLLLRSITDANSLKLLTFKILFHLEGCGTHTYLTLHTHSYTHQLLQTQRPRNCSACHLHGPPSRSSCYPLSRGHWRGSGLTTAVMSSLQRWRNSLMVCVWIQNIMWQFLAVSQQSESERVRDLTCLLVLVYIDFFHLQLLPTRLAPSFSPPSLK